MLRRFVFVLGALLLVGVGFGLPAQAGYTPPAGITIDKPAVDPGATVTVSGEGCAAGVEVTILLGETEVATATTGEDGTFSASFEVPAGTAAGTYTVDAVDCTVDVLSTTLTVRAAATTATTAAAGHGIDTFRSPARAPPRPSCGWASCCSPAVVCWSSRLAAGPPPLAEPSSVSLPAQSHAPRHLVQIRSLRRHGLNQVRQGCGRGASEPAPVEVHGLPVDDVGHSSHDLEPESLVQPASRIVLEDEVELHRVESGRAAPRPSNGRPAPPRGPVRDGAARRSSRRWPRGRPGRRRSASSCTRRRSASSSACRATTVVWAGRQPVVGEVLERAAARRAPVGSPRRRRRARRSRRTARHGPTATWVGGSPPRRRSWSASPEAHRIVADRIGRGYGPLDAGNAERHRPLLRAQRPGPASSALQRLRREHRLDRAVDRRLGHEVRRPRPRSTRHRPHPGSRRPVVDGRLRRRRRRAARSRRLVDVPCARRQLRWHGGAGVRRDLARARRSAGVGCAPPRRRRRLVVSAARARRASPRRAGRGRTAHPRQVGSRPNGSRRIPRTSHWWR